MREYWDYEPAERAAMTEEQVRDLCKFELMKQGVLQPMMPKALDETVPPIAVFPVFVLEIGGRELEGICFDSEEAAQAVIAAGFRITKSDYRAGYGEHANYSAPRPQDVSILRRLRPDETTFKQNLRLLEQAHKAKEANAKARTEFEQGMAKADAALQGVWEDWHEQRAVLLRVQKVRDTYTEYLGMCNGVASVARQFLAKVYKREEIEGALDPLVPECHAQPAQ